MVSRQRRMVVWIPDWPIIALAQDRGMRLGDAAAIAVWERNLITACSPAARAAGVRRGQRRRQAQARCPELMVVPADQARDHRVFAPLISRIEERAPGVQPIRPGLCALTARGPARYFGGEHEAATMLRDAVVDTGIADVRVGVADGIFTAEHAARAATEPLSPIRVVGEGEAAQFLAPLPVSTLIGESPSGVEELVSLLGRLGVHTLGDFARMDPDRVRDRFQSYGAHLHALAAGRDSRPVQARTPPPELSREVAFDPPVELADQVAFGIRVAAEEFIAGLGALDLVCTELRVEFTGDRAERSERVWLHPRCFDAAAVVDRVRWQLAEDGLRSGVTLVRLEPEAVDAASHHAPELFGTSPDERVHHALSRVQAMLGHRGVLTPAISGGRWLTERQLLVPWGDRVVVPPAAESPWPGSLPDPLPGTVFPVPRPVRVTTLAGWDVEVDDRGMVSAVPARVEVADSLRQIDSWAGPWPVVERMWDSARTRQAYRFQVIDEQAQAWLLVYENGTWMAEATYD